MFVSLILVAQACLMGILSVLVTENLETSMTLFSLFGKWATKRFCSGGDRWEQPPVHIFIY